MGKHGDHVGGEREALAVPETGAAAACAMLDLNWQAWTKDGTLDPASSAILTTTEHFDHCVFTVSPGLPAGASRTAWLKALLSMDYDDPGAPRDDGPRGAQGVGDRAHDGVRLLASACEHQKFFAGR